MRVTSVIGILYLSMCLAGGCSEQAGVNSAGGKSNISGPHFEFSAITAEQKGDWCRETFTTPVLISGDPADANKRLFVLGEGVHKIVIRLGNVAASFCLLKKGDSIELLTSQNFPMCLSRHRSYTMAADGLSFQYDNQLHITYTAFLQNQGTIVLEFPPDMQYGLTVHTCSGCKW